MLKKIAAFQVDPLHTLKPITDTSLMLAQEAQKRGFDVFAYTPENLYYSSSNGVCAKGVFFNVEPSGAVSQEMRETTINLNEASYVFIRQNPPFNLNYITPTYYLELLSHKVTVLNSPTSLRLFAEKTIPLYFKEFIPETFISTQKNEIVKFINLHQATILKPLFSFGGNNVFRLTREDSNLNSILDMSLQMYPEGLIAQPYIKDVEKGDKRLFFIDGKLQGGFKRIPASGQFLSNLASGGSAEICEFTSKEYEIAEAIGPFLKEKGFFLAGVDIIGGYLIEVNVTSPTGLRVYERLTGINLAEKFWDLL